MASGLPVIASAVGGNVEIIDNGKTGRLFEPRDTQALTGLIADYANDAQLRAAHARMARRAAVEKFALDTMVGKYEAIYTSLCYGSQTLSIQPHNADSGATS